MSVMYSKDEPSASGSSAKKQSPADLFLQSWNKFRPREVTLIREYQFCPWRKFRLDFAIVDLKIGVEIQGYGKHQFIAGMAADHEKLNLAVELGWVVLYHTSRSLGSKIKREEAIDQLIRVIVARKS